MNLIIKVSIFASILIIIISGVNNSIEMNTADFMGTKKAEAKKVTELTDVMSLASKMGDYTIDSEITPAQIAKAQRVKISFDVNNKRRPERVEQKEAPQSAYIQEEISLEIAEYFHPAKFEGQVLKVENQELPVSGTLEASSGVIERLDVTLPDGESIFIEYASMTQNRFKFSSSDGDQYRGIMYKIDAITYMVSLEEGPHKGTRLKFKNLDDVSSLYETQADIELASADNDDLAQKNGFVF